MILHIYFSFAYSHINHCSIAVASTSQTKLKEMFTKQWHAAGRKFIKEKKLMEDLI